MDDNDLEAMDRIVRAIEAACHNSQYVKSVDLYWESAGEDADGEAIVRPRLKIEFADAVVGEAVPA